MGSVKFESKFVGRQRTAELREMIDELNGDEIALSVGQIDFIDSVYYWEGNFTKRQAEAIERIYEEVVG